MSRLFLLALVVAGLVNYLCSLHILRVMAKSGARIGRFEIRWQVHKHLASYRQLTLERDGRVGLAWYGYRVSLGLLVLFLVLLLLSL
ncbi:hypothetical protein JCM30471_19710 [Desulfuromonas carbonis]|uniref:hypothetical protein n=1 Tax=Desulfuromonas sp. DDH964 TaxID=1823759 RepID=UPI00078EDBCA|nr:hypothetical protein [Desulfuromonas sp. DDH964]AMV73554.1 hypothetical protein DBW_3249 [Desulfuromonas sp. DDH964]